MKESKLVKLLRRLDKGEIKRFGEFVNSPYFNKNEKNSRVYEELIKYYPEFNSEEYSEEGVYKKSLNLKEYDYFAMKNILSDLHDLGLRFILTEHTGERMISKEIRMIEMLREKEVFEEYKKRLNKLNKKLEENKIESEFYFEDKLSLLNEEISYVSIFEPNTRFDLKQDELDTLINYSIVRILKHYCSLLHEQKQNNYPFKFTMMDAISEYLKSRSFENIPVINMYKNVLFLQLTGDYKYYKMLHEIRDKYFDNLNHGDTYMLFVYMRSFTVISFNTTSDPKFQRDCFELDKFMYAKGRFTLGKILYPDFIAAVKSAAVVKEFEWAEKFMDEMKGELMPDVKEDALNFCNGYIQYMKGNLHQAMELMYKVNFNLFIMQIQVYIILLKIYYLIGHYEDALNLAKSAKEYLNKEVALGDMQTNLKKFFNYTSTMVKLKMSVEPVEDLKFKYNKLGKEVDNMKFNYFGVKNWLLDQINNLK